ncbi:SRPBCC family protein [Caulobacter sp. 17J65-9]|uniref:SRPBCC family protein n=1 Tax=Caulobacter sp. 17J65-9 TaxID=2709382 RepID=UPI0013C6EE49|nr:SRPBCC family protein [Caulobacter sp. 17J65-9]NEX93198.1 polyketide cyclase [Caulobacter sp. 17J65-9]
MTERNVTHATFTIERTYPAAPARVFAAFADPVKKRRWFGGPEDWASGPYEMDFREGGQERISGGPAGGTVHHYLATFQDIVPDQRIVSTYEMHLDTTRISVSVATLQFKPDGAGTRLILTEQGAFLDGFDNPRLREEGTRELLDALGRALEAETAAA